MNRNTTAAVLLAVIVLFFSMTLTSETNVVYAPLQNQLDTTQQFTLSMPLILGVSAQADSQLNQSTRAQIYGLVQETPGVHFRGICNSLALSVGMIQYHLGILVSAGFLSVYSDGKMKRFFETSKYSQKQRKIISLLRHKTRGNILKIISNKKAITHAELANQLSITSQGLTWQIHRLEKEDLIQETYNGLKQTYFLNPKDTPIVSQLINIVE